jgi:hypothetical protein
MRTNEIADKSTSPSHQRTISLSDIRLARLTTVTDQQLTDATLQGTASALNNSTASGQTTGTIIAIKQESLSTVDNLVGSYVDSTTFLPSPNNQLGSLVQSHALTNEASGVNEGAKIEILKHF